MSSYTGTLTASQGARFIDVTPNDVVSFTTTGTYTVEYPVGTVAINASTAPQSLTANSSATQMRVLCVSGSVTYSNTDNNDGTPLTQTELASVRASVSGAGNILVTVDANGGTASATANRQAIQGALDAMALMAPNGGTVTLYSGSTSPAFIDIPLTIGDRTTLDAGNCEIKGINPNCTNLLVTKAYQQGGTAVTVTWSSGMTASVAWTAHGRAVGDAVSLARADQGFFNGVFLVASVVDANNFTIRLRRLPTTTPTGSIVARVAHKDITIRGGVWNYNKTGGNGGTGFQLHTMILGHVWNLSVDSPRFRDTTKFGLCIGAVAHVRLRRIGGDVLGSDTLKIYGPAFDVTGDGLFVGQGGDDIGSMQTREPVAFLAYDWTQGDVIGATLNGISGQSNTAGFPIYASPAGVIDGVELNGLRVETPANLAAVRIESQWTTGASEVGTVQINNLVAGGNGWALTLGNGADNVTIQKAILNNPICRFASNTGRLVHLLGTNTVANVLVRGGYAAGLDNVLNTNLNTGTITLHCDGLHLGSHWQTFRVGAAGTVNLSLRDCVFDNNPGNALISTAAAAAVVTLTAVNTKMPTIPTISLGAGAVLRLSGPCDIPLDGAILDSTVTNHAPGASFYNTNAAFGTGVGAYVRGASAWVRVAA